ncbi:MAG TPA: transketolase C-terminal domain-containing protein [Actinomycetota bacterium]|jgi:transketolase
MRPQLAATLSELFERDDRLAIVLAEISTDLFRGPRRLDPGRAVNVGIMEATMVGVAAGFAIEGFHPVAHTIGPFMAERPLEQLKLDFGYQGLEGTFVSVGGSYDYGAEGGTHHAPGDAGVMASIPGMEILAPGTAAEADRLVRTIYANGRASYLRASTAQNEVSFEVEPGRLEVVRQATQEDAPVVVAFGPMLSRALQAAEGLDVTVAYATSIVPFDAPGLAAIAGDHPHLIAVEPWYEGTVTGTFAAAVAHVPSRIDAIGVPRRFLRDYGTAAEHDRDLGLDADGIGGRLRSILAGRAA